MAAKQRLDLLLFERGLANSRQRAQALIMSGNVLVNDVPATKAGQLVDTEAQVRLRGEDHPYVSRGGLKLARAIEAFGVQCEGRVGLDVGASTGGFTQVLLLNGATRVFAVDAGHNQLDWKIRSDPRVTSHEKVNARYMEYGLIGQSVDIIVIDVSFISLEKILPALVQFDRGGNTDWITLIKPQFEVGRERVGKGGIVQDPADRQAAVDRITEFALSIGLERRGLIDSPIAGTDGNHEYLAHWRRKVV
jgi:23S rRNA (cytidine1920-2'-O)/16S rRNA (cytidine1409-2'-O)-methyltransferase